MTEYVRIGGLQVAAPLADLVDQEVTPGIGVDPKAFWTALAQAVRDFAPRNASLL